MRLLSNKDGAYSEYDVIGLNNCRVNDDVFKCSPKKQLTKVARNGRNKLVAILGGRIPCNKCGEGRNYAKGMFVAPRYELDPDLSNASYDFKTPEIEPDNLPGLKDTVEAALQVLERRLENSSFKGSFLMVEGGEVDWAGHSNDFAWMLASMHEFEEAVKTVVRHVEAPNNYNWNNTLVIVTSDHSCSFMRIDKKALKKLHSQGKTPKQKWALQREATRNGEFDDGEWFYGDKDKSPVVYKTIDHTNELVTIAARGSGAGALFTGLEKTRPCGGKARTGLLDNTQIFLGMMRSFNELGTKHIILMIADGMHEALEAAYSIMRYGEEGRLEWDKWRSRDGPDSYRGKVTTWDISTYDWYACKKGKARYKPDGCESQVGYDEAMTPLDSVSIGATPSDAEAYFLTMPKRR
jgi:alkaline phosphatase